MEEGVLCRHGEGGREAWGRGAGALPAFFVFFLAAFLPFSSLPPSLPFLLRARGVQNVRPNPFFLRGDPTGVRGLPSKTRHGWSLSER